MDDLRRYFYLCRFADRRLKLGITTRPLGHRLREYITSDPSANYFKVMRFARISIDELMAIEKQCLDATIQWFPDDIRARYPNNECRHGVAPDVLWQHITHLLSTGVEVTGDELALLGQDSVDEIKQPPEHKAVEQKKPDIRTRVQAEYVSELTALLKTHKRALMKAPTGFGKTCVYYGVIGALGVKRVLILTPRQNLCRQSTALKYIGTNHGYEISHLSDLSSSNEKSAELRRLAQYPRILVTACYQSADRIENAFVCGFAELGTPSFELIIFDEAHAILPRKHDDSLFIDTRLATYRLFGSATPTTHLETHPETYGALVEKIHVYELINACILCNIATLVKKVEPGTIDRSEYCNLAKLIEDGMGTYKKRKGIVYANTRANAYKILGLMCASKIRAFIYVSDGHDGQPYDQLADFEASTTPCVLIAVGMISYGYDNSDIDFICLADPRYSDVDIRQIVGRGLRWDHATYPNKLLHILLPMYPDEFGQYGKNEALQKYLCYIIGECGSDLVLKSLSGDSGLHNSHDSQPGVVAIYDGDIITACLYDEYCTGLWNSFANFERLLRANHAWDERSYNELRGIYSWMPSLGENVRKKYPNFCFMRVHPKATSWYQTRGEAETAQKISRLNVQRQKGDRVFRRMNTRDIESCMREMDSKLPHVDFDMYYPKQVK